MEYSLNRIPDMQVIQTVRPYEKTKATAPKKNINVIMDLSVQIINLVSKSFGEKLETVPDWKFEKFQSDITKILKKSLKK